MTSNKNRIIVHGFFRNGPPGLGNNANNIFNAIKKDYKVERNNISYKNLINKNNLIYKSSYEKFKNKEDLIHIFCLQPMHTFKIIKKIKNKRCTYRNFFIGYWAWEISDWPLEWYSCLDVIDEIWCPSKFVFDSIPLRNNKQKKFIIYPGIELDISKKRESRKVSKFIFSYDSKSKHQRKNPKGVLYAFWNAFGFPSENASNNYYKNVKLTIKIVPSKYPTGLEEISWIIETDPRIKIINKKILYREVIELYKEHDCFISLHKSEGFGYGIAENLLIGNEIITTNYSGTIDFCSHSNAYLIEYHKELIGNKYPHSSNNSVWANPNIIEASNILKKLVENNLRKNKFGPNVDLTKRTFRKKIIERIEEIKEFDARL